MSEKYTLMLAEKAQYAIARMARLLKVSRSGFYAWVKAQHRGGGEVPPRVARRRRLDHRVRRIWRESHKTYGAPRIRAKLAKEGVWVDRKTVAASMRRQGLVGISPRRFRPVTTLPGTRTHSIPDLCQRRWDTGSVDSVWVTDITYLRTLSGWVYLCGVKDACSRKIVSMAMSTTMTTDLVEEALRRARILRRGAPARVIIHSDRGAQFTSEQMWSCCKDLHLTQSMGRTGICWDNAMIESQWSVLKSEFYDRRTWASPAEAIPAVEEWVYDFYNTKRLNSAIGYQTPAEFEATQAADLDAAA